MAAGEFDDAKLGALATFTQAVMAKKGAVSDDELKAFFDAGYNQQQAVEVVMGVALAPCATTSTTLPKLKSTLNCRHLPNLIKGRLKIQTAF